MLDVIYYPVSFILWCWHWVFGLLLGDANAIGWALAIVLLVCTLRAILVKPAINQVRAMRKMQAIAPKMKAIQRRHADDRQRQYAEIQKLQREHGVSPLGGCLPLLLQIPVFIGLNHVLRAFTQYPDRANYVFPHSDVVSYLHATLFGSHLGDAILNLQAGSGHVWLWGVAPVAIPLMLAAAVATHLTARLSARRQLTAEDTPQARLIAGFSLYVAPLGVLAFGGALPIGLLLYWVSSNCWTLAQQHFLLRPADDQADRRASR